MGERIFLFIDGPSLILGGFPLVPKSTSYSRDTEHLKWLLKWGIVAI